MHFVLHSEHHESNQTFQPVGVITSVHWKKVGVTRNLKLIPI